MTGWLSKIVSRVDKALLRRTENRHSLSQLLTGLPTMIVTTIGAKSGLARSLPLAAIPDGECFYLIGSNFGGERHPAWVYNLRAHPQVQITVWGETRTYTVQETEGEVYERGWYLGDAYFAGYRKYRRRVRNRRIPVFLLEPEES
jgi:deazaflavin-dependent oxidoreductase (nitroreductase family)